mgnify:CR=1 FL=1
MSEIANSVSAREWAFAFWLLVLVVFVAWSRTTRSSLRALVATFIQPLIIGPLLVAAIYAAGEVFLLAHLGWWSLANLKTTLLWAIAFAFVAMFEIVSIKERKRALGKVARDIFSVAGLVTFIAELKSFPLPVELIALPVVTFIGLMAEFAKVRPEHQRVAGPLGCFVGMIGLFYIGYSVWLTYLEWAETATWATALDFLIPFILSIGFLPFLWLWQIFVVYSDTFATITFGGIDKKLVPAARWLAATRIRSDLELLERWRVALRTTRPATKAEFRHSLVVLKALRAREASPPSVRPEQGWSQYLALQFMADLGYDMGYYRQHFDDEWGASSPMRQIGPDAAVFRNNLAYYIEGDEAAATSLKFKLNVNDPANAREAEEMFVVGSFHLLEQAISLDAAERLTNRIAPLRSFTADIPFGQVSLERTDFMGGIKGGYSRIFEIRRGPED